MNWRERLSDWLPRRFRVIALAIVLLVILDQSVKVWVKLSMQPGDEILLLGEFFKLHFIENKGAAFGLTLASLFGSLDEHSAKILLSLFSIVLCICLAWYLRRVVHYKSRLPIYVALILAGALGNIIDRVYYGVWFAYENDYEGGLFEGRVVDMFYLDLWAGTVPSGVPLLGGQFLALWPIFNLADVYISLGILLIVFGNRHLFSAEGRTAESTQTPEEKA